MGWPRGTRSRDRSCSEPWIEAYWVTDLLPAMLSLPESLPYLLPSALFLPGKREVMKLACPPPPVSSSAEGRTLCPTWKNLLKSYLAVVYHIRDVSESSEFLELSKFW